MRLWDFLRHRWMFAQSRRTGERCSDQPRGLVLHAWRRRNARGDSPRFSMEFNKADFPWIYEKGNKPGLVISTLEAMAVVIALKLKLRYGQDWGREHTKVIVVPSITEKRGNAVALNKLMSTKFPSSAVQVELAAFLKNQGSRTIVEWGPREFNRESDNLANGDTDGFNPELEMKANPRELA